MMGSVIISHRSASHLPSFYTVAAAGPYCTSIIYCHVCRLGEESACSDPLCLCERARLCSFLLLFWFTGGEVECVCACVSPCVCVYVCVSNNSAGSLAAGQFHDGEGVSGGVEERVRRGVTEGGMRSRES